MSEKKIVKSKKYTKNKKLEQRQKKEKINALNTYVRECEHQNLKMQLIERTEPLRPRVVISFSTIPSRVNKLAPLFKALKSQTYKPDAIYLNIPKRSIRDDCEYDIEWHTYNNAKFLKINHMERDYGPLTKLIGGLQQETEPDTIIVTIDDDKQYDSHMIEDLVTYSQKFFNTGRVCAVGRRGWILCRPELRWPSFSYLPIALDIKTPVNVDVLTGVGAVAYRRSMFDDTFPNDELLEKCFMVDDIYINGYLAQHGIERILIPSYPNIFMKLMKTTHTDNTYIDDNPLWNKNKDGVNNNRALKLFRQYF